MFDLLIVEKDVSIKIRDGSILYANIFRPADSSQFSIILTLGPYPKDIHFRQWVPSAYDKGIERDNLDPYRRVVQLPFAAAGHSGAKVH